MKRHKLLPLFILISILLNDVVASVFSTIDRSDEPKYSVRIERNPEILNLPGQLVEMTSPISKQKYHCLLPLEGDINNEHDKEAEPEVLMEVLLEPMLSSCVYRLTGWWTYEFCYGKHIRQFHQEQNQPIRPQDDYYLGKWTDEFQTGIEHLESDPKYFSLQYSEGTECDLTGKKRTTEVKFVCSSEKGLSAILDVKEPFSCVYSITVATPYVCQHPNFKPKKENVNPIICSPQSQDSMTDEELLKETQVFNKVLVNEQAETPETYRRDQQEIVVTMEQLAAAGITAEKFADPQFQKELLESISVDQFGQVVINSPNGPNSVPSTAESAKSRAQTNQANQKNPDSKKPYQRKPAGVHDRNELKEVPEEKKWDSKVAFERLQRFVDQHERDSVDDAEHEHSSNEDTGYRRVKAKKKQEL